MLTRFSLYGFLKNQRYFEPFLILVFLEKGLSFFEIGLLIGFREICINLFEIPSGAAADLYGRRRAMMFSFLNYIVSFIIFALSNSVALLCLAMLFFAIGDSFRTGTHKAMIFDWLKREGRESEKTKIYGFTRSWSKKGSAVSVFIASGLVFYSGEYGDIFLYSIPPYLVAIWNFWHYPNYLDGEKQADISIRKVGAHFIDGLKLTWRSTNLRRLTIEAMAFEGVFKTVKDYLQPVLQGAALALPFLMSLPGEKRTALLVGGVYFALYIASATASRQAHRLLNLRDNVIHASKWLWQFYLAVFLLMLAGLGFGWLFLAVVGFIAINILQNFWRPIIVSRFDDHAPPEKGATILSIESQSRSFVTMLLAPVLGLLVDVWGLTPVAFAGIVSCSIILAGYYGKTDR